MPRAINIRRQYLRWQVISRLELIGMGREAMAKATGFSERHIEMTLSSPAYQEWCNASIRSVVSAADPALAQDYATLKLSLQHLVPAVIRRLERCLNDPDNSIALRACQEILDRDERFQKQQNIAVSHSLIPSAELDRARVLARELRSKQGEAPVLDVTPKQLEAAEPTPVVSVTPIEQSN